MEIILITGALSPLGQELTAKLTGAKNKIIAIDETDPDDNFVSKVNKFVKAKVGDKNALDSLFSEYQFSQVYHLAGLSIVESEENPEKAQEINVNQTATLLDVVNKFSVEEEIEVKFIFPSTIAVYGLPSLEIKSKFGSAKENDYLKPITIYGITKLYCEMLGVYYANNFRILSGQKSFLDFRSIRLPGVISALTPAAGSETRSLEMIHTLASGEGYESFVRESTKIPFIAMPDAVNALIQLSQAAKEKLSRQVYNVSGFSATADQIAKIINGVFPDSSISYSPDPNKQKIVDSWPEEIDDSNAKKDWGWKPEYDMEKTYKSYLVQEITNKH